MKIIKYVFFEQPGEKQKLQEIVEKSFGKVDMAGRVMQEFNLNVEEANIVAEKFFNKAK